VPPIQLQSWARTVDGWIVFESSAGFRLADGSVRSPEKDGVVHQLSVLSDASRLEATAEFPGLVIELEQIWAG
jgi:Uma2 family endonuclease